MAVFTRHTRLPLERAIEMVEAILEPAHRVSRQDIEKAVCTKAPEAAAILDHTIKVMVHGGYVRRVHVGPNCLAYEKTERWAERNDTLIFLRAPSYKKRFRPRSKGKLIRPAAGTLSEAMQLHHENATAGQLQG